MAVTETVVHERAGVCAPQGFVAGAAAAGVRADGDDARLDIAIVASQRPCVAAGVFTRNIVKAAPVVISQLTLRRNGSVHAVVINSGNANACTGPQGFRDALRMAASTGDACAAEPGEVLVCSTGVIGRPMPMERVLDGIRTAASRLDAGGGDAVSRAIMTTDTIPKTASASTVIDGRTICVGGMAKGAGMIHPDMATLLAVLTTDAAAERDALQALIADVCGRTFNCLSIDGDTSTNDSLLLLANGAAGTTPIAVNSPQYDLLRDAVEEVCTSLVEQLAADAEGATTSIICDVTGAVDPEQARAAARTVIGSPLVKTAVHGSDPNWGRIVAALGRSGATFALDRCHVAIGGVPVFAGGQPVLVDLDRIREAFTSDRVVIAVDLGAGEGEGRAWGCDLSAEYVSINADYTT